MNRRAENLAAFIAIAEKLFQSEKLPECGCRVAARVFERLQTPSDDGVRPQTRYPACEWLDATLAPFIDDDTAPRRRRTRGQIARTRSWMGSRRSSGVSGSDDYIDAHVHGMICGPGARKAAMTCNRASR